MRLRVWALFGLLVFLSSGPLYAASSELARVKALLEQDDWDQALALLDKMNVAPEEDVQRRFFKATALLKRGEWAPAAALFEALIRDYPNLPEPYNNLAGIYVRQGRLDEAKDLLLKAIKTHESYNAVYENLNQVYAEKSRRAYAKALVLDDVPRLESLNTLLALSSPRAVEAVPPLALVVAEQKSAKLAEVRVAEPEPAPPPVVVAMGEVAASVPLTEPAPVVVAEPEAVPLAMPTKPLVEAATVSEDAEPELPISKTGASLDAVPLKRESATLAQAPENTVPETAVPKPVAIAVADNEAETSGQAFSSVEAVMEDVLASVNPLAAPVSEAVADAAPSTSATLAQPESLVANPQSADESLPAGVGEFLLAWAAAWSAQDVSAYLGYYSSEFNSSTGMSREDWAELRRSRILRPAWVKVELDEFELKAVSEQGVRLRLNQHYRTPGYQDVTLKEFILIKDADNWKIAEEKSLKISR